MNINKLIYKSEQLVSLYCSQERESDLVGMKKITGGIGSKGYILNVKFLYLYQKCKWKYALPEWFSKLSQKKIIELEQYFSDALTHILNDENLNEEELNHFLDKRVIWLYKGKYRVYPTTPFDYLPLKLRLKVYNYMYSAEDDPNSCCHLRNRIAITLAKLGHLDLSNLLSIYNWLMSQEINTHFASSINLKKTVMNHKRLNECDKELVREEQEVTTLTELCFYYTNLINTQTLKYDRAHLVSIDLVELWYKQYPQLQKLNLPLKTYLRTKDIRELYDKVAQKRMNYIREFASVPSRTTTFELDEITKDQLNLYNYLLRICM